jgi:dienelactone hydrolase
MTVRMRCGLFLIVAAGLGALIRVRAQAPPSSDYTTSFYVRDGLRLQSYLYLPAEGAAAPLVVYHHGSRIGFDRLERPFPWLARVFTAAGYAVLIPERRGYGKSDGKTFTEEVGRDRGKAFLARLEAETDDALAAIDDALKTHAERIDSRRIAMVGWSFGGIVSVLGGARSPRFAAIVAQAPGSLNWDRSPVLRTALLDAAGRIRAPLQCLVAANDATIESAKQVCARAAAGGTTATFKLYPAFTPPSPSDIPAGHLVFTNDGLPFWKEDVLAFLAASFRRL